MPYGTDQGLTDYLSLSGRTLPVTTTPTIARYWGSMYVNGLESKYRGAAIALPDSFPRDIYNPVPVPVEYAAYEAGLAWAEGVDLFGGSGTAGGQVIREKIDVMEVQYAEPKGDGLQGWYDNNFFIWRLAYQYLQPYMKVSGFFPAAFVVGGGHIGC